MPFVKANYDDNSGTTFFKIKAGDRGEKGHNFFRIMPPYGKHAESEKICVYGAQHFGYSVPNEREPNGKPVASPFGCIEEKDFKTKMITNSCPECENRYGVIEQQEQLEAKLKVEGKSEEEIKEETSKYTDWLRQHNRESKFYFAVMNEKREFGVIKIGSDLKKKLLGLIKDLKSKKNVDATDVDQGVWFDFQRSGESFTNTMYDVEIVYEDKRLPTGEIVNALKLEPLSVEEQDKAIKNLPELLDLITYISAEQMAKLVASNGDPEVVAAVLNVSKPKGTQEAASNRATRSEVRLPPQKLQTQQPAASTAGAERAPQATPGPVAGPTPTPASAAPAVDDEEAALEAQLAAARARKAAAKAGQPTPSAGPAQLAPKSGGLSSEKFLNNWGFQENAASGATK